MPGLLPRALRREAGDRSFIVFLVTVALCLLRARDLPTFTIGAGTTDISIGPADVALLITAALAANRLRQRRAVPSAPLLAATAAFGLLVFLTSLGNGGDAVIAAGKLLELAALTFGAAVFVDSPQRLQALVVVLVAFTSVAVLTAVVQFVGADGGRQASFVGEHDLAALATMALAVGLALVNGRRGSPSPLAILGLVVGLTGVILGASLASLLGVYLATLVILAIAVRKHDFRPAATLLAVAVAGFATAGTLAMRQGDLGFLQSWFGPAPETPGQYAASWSQRLIYVYVGGRVFLDRPLLGTGWQDELPPSDFAKYVPDARARFPDQPAHYFPDTERDYIPQQAYDQVLFELGVVGAALFAAVSLLAVWRARAATARHDAESAYLPAAWLACVAGALAGAALFGGSPLTALFWLAIGVAAAKFKGEAA